MPISAPSNRPVVDLEHVVRPFVSPVSKPDRSRNFAYGGSRSSGSVQTSEGEEVPTLEWTARANVEVMTLAGRGFTVSLIDESVEREEISRETRVVRIENPEDSNQYVDVEVIDAISFQDPNRSKRRYTLNNGEGS